MGRGHLVVIVSVVMRRRRRHFRTSRARPRGTLLPHFGSVYFRAFVHLVELDHKFRLVVNVPLELGLHFAFDLV